MGGEATPPGLGVTGGAPVSSASTSSPAVGHSGIASTGVGMSGMMAGGMGGGNGVRAAAAGAATTAGAGASGVGAEAGAGAGAAASNGGWGMSDVAVGGVGGGSGVGGGLGSALGESVMSGSQGHPVGVGGGGRGGGGESNSRPGSSQSVKVGKRSLVPIFTYYTCIVFLFSCVFSLPKGWLFLLQGRGGFCLLLNWNVAIVLSCIDVSYVAYRIIGNLFLLLLSSYEKYNVFVGFRI